MRLIRFSPLSVLAFALWGCGGSSSPIQNPGTTADFGQLKLTSSSALKPLVGIGLNNVTVTGASGSTITAARLSPVPTVANSELFGLTGGGVLLQIQGTSLSPVGNGSLGNLAAISFTPTGHIAYEGVSPTDGKLGVYTCAYDGSAPTKMFEQSSSGSAFAWSPLNTSVAYRTSTALVVSSINGTNTTTISGVGDEPSYSPDGSKIVFRNFDTQSLKFQIEIYDIGSKSVTKFRTEGNFANPCYTPDGKYIAYIDLTNDSLDICTLSGNNFWIIQGQVYGLAILDRFQFSPDEKNVAILGFQTQNSTNEELLTTLLDGTFVSESSLQNDVLFFDFKWSPFFAPQAMIGTSSATFAKADGFLWGQSGSSFASFVDFTTTNDTPATITSENTAGGSLVYNISATGSGNVLTGLKYTNSYYGLVSNVPVGTTNVLVSFDATTGQVAALAPFVLKRGAVHPARQQIGGKLTFEASFSALYDAHGKNLAPHGAQRVVLDGRSGKLLEALD